MQPQTMKLRELTIRYAVRKDHEGQPVIVGRALGRPSEAASALMALLRDEPAGSIRYLVPDDEVSRDRVPRGCPCRLDCSIKNIF
jgi:hypothetical protein